MESQKFEIIKKIDEKGLTPQKLAEAIGFDPELLSLYLAKDAYPIPTRIMKKIEEAVMN
jgi:hypothetical protein